MQPLNPQETSARGGRPIYHALTGRRFDLAAEQPDELIEFLASLHDNLRHDQHGLTCLTAGGDKRVYVIKRSDGSYSVRHYPGSAHHADHHVIPESDEHRRGKDYSLRALVTAGIPAGTEICSNNGTKSDVAAFGEVAIAAEIQMSYINAPDVKRRDTRARHATAITTEAFARPLLQGLKPVWAQLHGGQAAWLYRVPSVTATIASTVWADHLPAPRTVGAFGVRRIDPEKCRVGCRWDQCPMTGRAWCGGWHPIASTPEDYEKRQRYTMDDILVLAARALLQPLLYHTGAVYLVTPEDLVRYEELGGKGEYAPGNRGSTRRLGPCRYHGHKPNAAQMAQPLLEPLEAQAHASEQANFVRTAPAQEAPRATAARHDPAERTPPGICPLCDQEHAGCEFRRGLYCVRVDCQSPHHRTPPRGW